MGGGEQRRIRSDKKKDIKPTLRIDLKDALYRLSDITYTPVKDVAAALCMAVLKDRKAIEHLSLHFKRDYKLDNTILRGHVENVHIGHRDAGTTERITTRFKRDDYEIIALLAYALDCTPSRMVAIALEISVRNIRFVNDYIRTYLGTQLNEEQMYELKIVMKNVNKLNEEHHSWAAFLASLFEEVSAPINRVKDAVNEFINKNKE